MKRFILLSITAIFLLSFNSLQDNSSAAEYFTQVFDIMRDVSKKQLKYSRSIIYKRREAKVERKKSKLLKESKDAIKKLKKLGSFNDDPKLIEVAIDVLKKSTKLMEVDMENLSKLQEKAYDSYENMVIYLEESEILMTALGNEQNRLGEAQEEFASENGFTLSENHSRMAKQMKMISQLNKYMTPIYLSVFKVEKEVVGFFEALNEEDFDSAEEFLETIKKDGRSSSKEIRTAGNFKGSSMYSIKANTLIKFFERCAKSTYPKIIKYYKKGNRMTKAEYKQYQTLMKSYNKDFNKKNSDYYNSYYEFQQKFVSRF